MFHKIPENKNIPDDIYLLKEIKDKENHTHYAPSILLYDGDRKASEEELESLLLWRRVDLGGKGQVDVMVRNNSYLPVRDRKLRLYYVPKEEAVEGQKWRLLKSPSGLDYTEVGLVLPFQDVAGRESFLMPKEEEGPFYLIAALDEEEEETVLTEDKVDLNELNESYYWCILDSEEIMA